ncbi:MAG TPA: hypothetical protein VEP90_08370, partial [Methylomirabilota bacterium]|nr:hypothetical protein [Methylomirabilota bacterium]
LIEKLFYEVMTREKIEPYMNWEFEDEMEEIIINCGAIRGYSEYKYRLSSHLIDNVFVPPPKRIARGGEKKILEWWEKMKAEQLRYYNFQNLLDKIMKILREEKVNATSTEYAEPTSQQSFADKKNQVANELVHMPKFHARVKLPTGEYLISTIQPNDADQMRESGIIRDGGEVKKTMTFSQKKRRIIENTRENYCKPRAEVEDEIRRRQDVGKPPPPITRQHQV